VLAYETGKR